MSEPPSSFTSGEQPLGKQQLEAKFEPKPSNCALTAGCQHGFVRDERALSHIRSTKSEQHGHQGAKPWQLATLSIALA